MFGLFGGRNREAPLEASWMIGLGGDESCPEIYRIREDDPAGIDPGDYATHITLTWRYQPDERGMPGEQDDARMQAFEDHLEENDELSGLAVMVLAITGGGTKEWHFYSRNAEEDAAWFGRLIRENGFPIEASQEPDPNWSTYREIRDAVQGV